MAVPAGWRAVQPESRPGAPRARCLLRARGRTCSILSDPAGFRPRSASVLTAGTCGTCLCAGRGGPWEVSAGGSTRARMVPGLLTRLRGRWAKVPPPPRPHHPDVRHRTLALRASTARFLAARTLTESSPLSEHPPRSRIPDGDGRISSGILDLGEVPRAARLTAPRRSGGSCAAARCPRACPRTRGGTGWPRSAARGGGCP